MNSHSPRARLGFTLIELLTVIAIIAILMGLLFPAIAIVKDQANKARAKNDVTNIVAAVKQYNVEYGKYPVIEDPIADATKDALCGSGNAGATINNSELFNTLRAIPEGLNKTPPHRMNPKRVVFFENRAVANPDQPRGGFLDKPGTTNADKKGSFYDPWGEQYTIVIDQTYNNIIDLQNQYTDFVETSGDTTDKQKGARAGVGAFSLGKDNKLGKNGDKMYKNGTVVSDDILSWQ